jgi:hypothetical protein
MLIRLLPRGYQFAHGDLARSPRFYESLFQLRLRNSAGRPNVENCPKRFCHWHPMDVFPFSQGHILNVGPEDGKYRSSAALFE